MTRSAIAVVGCGVIAPVYASTLSRFDHVEVVACVDGISERAERLAAECGARVASFEGVLADGGIAAVINLTPPRAHARVSVAALQASKAVFSEKPLGVSFDEGMAIVETARGHGVRLGCAPDTFLGTGFQTARAAIDRGDIGVPLAASGFMLSAGAEWWHPDPAFFYRPGGGPLHDMGPYYLTALVHLLGPACSVTASARMLRPRRVITSEPLAGTLIDVEVPTHVTALIDFRGGATATLMTSFDVQASRHRSIEVYGTEATLSVPDPNSFEGPVQLRGLHDREWRDVTPIEATVSQSRGVGLAEMMWAERSGRPHRASADVALHVLEIMTLSIESSERGQRLDLTSTCEAPALLPSGLPPNTFDD